MSTVFFNPIFQISARFSYLKKGCNFHLCWTIHRLHVFSCDKSLSLGGIRIGLRVLAPLKMTSISISVHLYSSFRIWLFCRFLNVALQFFLLRPLCILCHSTFSWGGATPSQIQLPGEHTGPTNLSYEAVLNMGSPFIIWPFTCSIHSHAHLWQIEVQWMGMFWWTACGLLWLVHWYVKKFF